MQPNEQRTRIILDGGSVLKAALILVALYAAYLLRDLLLIVLTAVVIASAIEPGAKWLQKRKIPRLPSVIIIYVLVALILFSVFYFIVPPFLQEMVSFLSTIPDYVSSLTFLDSVESLQQFSSAVGEGPSVSPESLPQIVPFRDLLASLSTYVSRIPGGVFGAVSAIFGGVLSLILIIVISFYLAVQERGIENFLHVITPSRHEAYVIDLWHRAKYKIGRWMQGQLLLMLLIGILVFLGLSIAGVRHAFLFAILAAVFELIPLFGPVLASIPAIAVAFVNGGITLALVVAGIYIIIQQFENHLIYPLVVNKVVGVPALLVILALIIGGQLVGFLGIILAVPVATILMELALDYEKRNQRLKKANERQ